jgi:hypothetical protein
LAKDSGFRTTILSFSPSTLSTTPSAVGTTGRSLMSQLPMTEPSWAVTIRRVSVPSHVTGSGSIEDPNLGTFRFALDAMVDKHMPFPAFVLDGSWNVVLANASATAMLDPGERNMVRRMFGGHLQSMIDNWDAVAWNGLARLRQDASNHPDSEELAELIEHARGSLVGTPRPSSVGSSLVTCPHLRLNGTIIPTITVTAQFTAARTATTDELRIQLVFPETEAGVELFTQLANAP